MPRGRLPRWARPGLTAYAAVHCAIWIFVALSDFRTQQGFWSQLARWDGRWFLLAANHGWPRSLPTFDGHVAQSPIAFFPLFPLLLRMASVGHHLPIVVTSVVLCTALGAGAIVAVARLGLEIGGESMAQRSGLLLAGAPGAFTFSFIYAEGLFLILAVLSLLAMIHRRWWLAGVAAAVATAVTALGLALGLAALAALVHEWRTTRRGGPLLTMALTPVGMAGYMLYLWRHTGDLAAWFHTERGGWKSYATLRFPAHVVWQSISSPLAPTMTGHLLFVGTVVTMVLVWRLVRARLPHPVAWFALGVVLLSAISSPVGLRPRFLLCAFPLLYGLTDLPEKPWRWTVGLSILALAAMSVEELLSSAVFP